jgi:hypothetical protein
MKIAKVCVAVGVALLAALPAFAQQDEKTQIASLEFQKLKPGMSTQYEAGRKQKAAWHKSQNDSAPLFVWEIMNGEDTGTYIVGRLGLHWADMDHPSVPDQADLDEFNKAMGNYVESVVRRDYALMTKSSNAGDMSGGPGKFAEVTTFRVKYGHEDDFVAGVQRVTEAAKKTNWPPKWQFFHLASGGNTDIYVLVEDHPNWADMEDKPDTKPFPVMLNEAFGHAQAESMMHDFDNSVVEETHEIIQFRADLSYMPGK